jgi:hypothetical protein
MKSLMREHGTRKSRESGQGILEYSVIIVLVVIILISFVALFGVDLFNRFISNRARASEEQSVQPSPEPVVSLIETGTTVEVIEVENIRIRNCPGDEPYVPDLERKLWIDHEIELEGQFSGASRPRSIASIQRYYGFNAGDREDRTFSLNLEAPTESIVDYTIEWQSILKEGNISITQADGSSEVINYRANVDLEFEITQLEQSPCEAAPTP